MRISRTRSEAERVGWMRVLGGLLLCQTQNLKNTAKANLYGNGFCCVYGHHSNIALASMFAKFFASDSVQKAFTQ